MMLNGSVAMLLTSDDRVEGNCRAVTEAMLVGCPVIYTAPQRMCTTWLTPETSLAAAPEAEAINRACRTYQRWSRQEIRRLTLQRVGRYRWDLQETVEKAAKQLGYSDFHLNVQALVDARYVRWQDRAQWLTALPSIIRQQLDR